MLSSAEQKERNTWIAAILGALLFHALVFVALLFSTIQPKDHLHNTEGVEVNNGYFFNDSLNSINSDIQFTTSEKDSSTKLP
jgi:hypothetical protein